MAAISTSDASNGRSKDESHESQRRLRELALWYREFADRTENPAIWEARLQTAERLEWDAERLAEESKRR